MALSSATGAKSCASSQALPSGGDLHSKSVMWYVSGPPKIPKDMKELLVQWSGFKDEDGEIERHVERIVSEPSGSNTLGRGIEMKFCIESDIAKIFFPLASGTKHGKSTIILAVGGYLFLNLGLATHSSFNTVVSLLKATSTTTVVPLLLDLGCGLGQDIRSLAFAGLPTDRVFGVDLVPAFIDVGYGLFRDAKKLESKFFVGDIFNLDERNAKSPALSNQNMGSLLSLVGRIKIIWAGSFLHLWDIPQQIHVCCNMIRLLRTEPGVRIIGRGAARRPPDNIELLSGPSWTLHKRSRESFRQMWVKALDCEDMLDGESPLRSKENGTWLVKSWHIEGVALNAVDQRDDVWVKAITGNGMEDSVITDRGSEANLTVTEKDPGAQRQGYFLGWEVERIV